MRLIAGKYSSSKGKVALTQKLFPMHFLVNGHIFILAD